MVWTRRRTAIAIAAAAVVAVAGLISGLLAACGGGAAPPRAVASPSPSQTGPLTSPFTGERVNSLGSRLAKKALLKLIKKAYEKKVYEIYFTSFVMN